MLLVPDVVGALINFFNRLFYWLAQIDRYDYFYLRAGFQTFYKLNNLSKLLAWNVIATVGYANCEMFSERNCARHPIGTLTCGQFWQAIRIEERPTGWWLGTATGSIYAGRHTILKFLVIDNCGRL